MSASYTKRTTHCLARSEVDQIQRSNLLIRMMQEPATMLTPWEQGFIAALTMFEGEVDAQLQKLEEKVAWLKYTMS